MTTRKTPEPDVVARLRALGVTEKTDEYDKGETRLTVRPLAKLRKAAKKKA